MTKSFSGFALLAVRGGRQPASGLPSPLSPRQFISAEVLRLSFDPSLKFADFISGMAS